MILDTALRPRALGLGRSYGRRVIIDDSRNLLYRRLSDLEQIILLVAGPLDLVDDVYGARYIHFWRLNISKVFSVAVHQGRLVSGIAPWR